MSVALDVAACVLLCAGSFFLLTGAVGILRFPDFFSRLHAAGKTDSFAQALIMLGLLCLVHRFPEIGPGAAVRLVLIVLFIAATAPVATHAITKAAQLDGLQPWKPKEPADDR